MHQVGARPRRKNSPGLGAKETKEQGLEGLRAPSRRPAPEEKWPGTWCKGNEGTRVKGLSCTKSAPAPEEKWPGTWCKGNEGTRVRGLTCTKPAPAPEEKWRGLGAKETEEQGLAVFHAPSRPPGARLGQRPVTSAGGPALDRRPSPAPPAFNPSTGS